MRFATIAEGIVDNIIEAEKDYAVSIGAIPVLDIGVNIGDEFVNEKFRIRSSESEFIEIEPAAISNGPPTLSLEEKYEQLKQQQELQEDAINFLIMGVM